ELSRYLRDVPLSLYLGLYRNETAGGCAWFVPALHYLEAWSDARAYDGTASLVQPLIAPLYGGKTPAHVLAALDGRPGADAHEMVRESWRRRVGMKGFEHFWDAALQRGVISGTAAAVV